MATLYLAPTSCLHDPHSPSYPYLDDYRDKMASNSILKKLSRKLTGKKPSTMQSSDHAPLTRPTYDDPPAYTPVADKKSSHPAPSISSNNDDQYAFLSTFDTVFLIDDSGSMAGARWTETGAALEAITPICVTHDSDGIDVHFLNTPLSPYHKNLTSASTVREIFSTVHPRGATPTGQRLNAILKPYLQDCKTKGPESVKLLNIIVITDGVPTDDVESPLIRAAERLDEMDAPAWQVGVQFFQVGRDEDAKRHLTRLDDEMSALAGKRVRDIVDTVPFVGNRGGSLTGEGILKVVLGAVNRRLDRKGSAELYR